MSDFTPETGDVPSLFTQLIASLMRSWLNAGAGVLVSVGALQDDQASQLVTILLGIGMWAANYSWSVVQKRNAQRLLKAAIAAPAPGMTGLAYHAGPLGKSK